MKRAKIIMENNNIRTLYNSIIIKENFSLDVIKNENVLFDLNEGINNVNIHLKKDSSLFLSIVAREEFISAKIVIDMEENANLNVYFADFSSKNSNISLLVNENGENDNTIVNLASLSSGKDNKKVDVSLNHFVSFTNGEVNCYGVSKDESRLLFLGTSHIFKGAKKSKTSQKAKIMVFDSLSKGICKPVLKIDENDVAANHAAAVGKIADDTMFYLMSRGLSKEESKELITLGYLRPILNGFKDEEYLDIISSLIKEKM